MQIDFRRLGNSAAGAPLPEKNGTRCAVLLKVSGGIRFNKPVKPINIYAKLNTYRDHGCVLVCVCVGGGGGGRE